jgi:type III pantothenate kinase
MLLAIDIGNTSTVLGLYDGERLAGHHRFGTNRSLKASELNSQLTALMKSMGSDKIEIREAVIASVVPILNDIYTEEIKRAFGISAIFVSHLVKLPVKLGYHDPSMLGADRIANAVAGFVKFGGPIIVVDYGTATKFEVVTDNGFYVGGVIAPGAELGANALAEKAARLFKVEPRVPEHAIGRTTEEAMKSGLFWGTIGQVDRIIKSLLDEIGGQARVVATGGLAGLFAPHSQYIETYYPYLTLDGLRIIYEYQAL